MPLTDEQKAKIRAYMVDSMPGHLKAVYEDDLVPEETDSNEVCAFLEELVAGLRQPPATLSRDAAKLAVMVLEPFRDNSSFEDYQDEDRWTSEEYEAMLAELRAVAGETKEHA